MLKFKTLGALLVAAMCSSMAFADPVGDLLDEIVALNKAEFQAYDGYLFKGWLVLDEEDPPYVVYVGNRKYKVNLDDGRGTSERAKACKEENFFDENPLTGCAITFDGQYIIDDSSGSISVSIIMWNVTFK